MKKYKKIYIEITNRCNLNCSFCSKVEKPLRNMTIEEFKLIISKIKDKTDTIYLHVKGEPLLHPNLVDFLDIAEENNLKVNITTNGTLFPQIVDKIKEGRFFCPLLLLLLRANQRNRTLDKVRKILALQHSVREECEVDNLSHQSVLLANLLEADVALVTKGYNLLRELLLHILLLGREILVLLAFGHLLEAALLGYGSIDLLGDALQLVAV